MPAVQLSYQHAVRNPSESQSTKPIPPFTGSVTKLIVKNHMLEIRNDTFVFLVFVLLIGIVTFSQLLNHVIIIKPQIPLPQVEVIIVNVGYPI
jgi:hypothetical protein